MSSETELIDSLTRVVSVFDELGVRCFVGGSIASSVYGTPRTTLDADLVADMDATHAADFCDQLQDDFYVSRAMIDDAVRRRASFNVIHFTTVMKIDVFVLKDRDFDRASLGRCRLARVGSDTAPFETLVAPPEDVVLNKLERFEKGNRLSERQWLDVLGVLRVQHDSLDLEYLQHWAAELGLTWLLETAIEDAAK